MSREKYDEMNPHSREIPDRDVVMFSGGIDSAVTALMLRDEGRNPLLVLADTGCDDMNDAKRRGRRIADILGLELVVDDGMIGYMGGSATGSNIYIPYRNLLFAIMGSRYGRRVYIGGIKGDWSPDKTPEVFDMFKSLLNMSNGPDERLELVGSILWGHDKVDVGRECVERGVPELVYETLGCYHPIDEEHCGGCLACFRKYCMMVELGLDTEGYFVEDPVESEAGRAYRQMFESGEWDVNIPFETARKVFSR